MRQPEYNVLLRLLVFFSEALVLTVFLFCGAQRCLFSSPSPAPSLAIRQTQDKIPGSLESGNLDNSHKKSWIRIHKCTRGNPKCFDFKAVNEDWQKIYAAGLEGTTRTKIRFSEITQTSLYTDGVVPARDDPLLWRRNGKSLTVPKDGILKKPLYAVTLDGDQMEIDEILRPFVEKEIYRR